MAAYRRVYDSSHLQADCQEPGSAPEPYARQSSMGYLYLFYPLTARDSNNYMMTRLAANRKSGHVNGHLRRRSTTQDSSIRPQPTQTDPRDALCYIADTAIDHSRHRQTHPSPPPTPDLLTDKQTSGQSNWTRGRIAAAH